MYFYGPISDSSKLEQITSGKFFCQKSRDPDQENTFQKSGTELYIVAFSWVLSSNENPSRMSSKACFVTIYKCKAVPGPDEKKRTDYSHWQLSRDM